MDGGVELKHGKSVVTGCHGLHCEEIPSFWAVVTVEEFVALEDVGDIILGAWVFDETQVHIGTLLVMIRNEED